MILNFSINYKTKWGENLYVIGDCKELGDNILVNAFKLTYVAGDYWVGCINIDPDKIKVISYRYLLIDEFGMVSFEAGKERKISLSGSTKIVTSYDQWQGNSYYSPFLTAPFAEVFYSKPSSPYTQISKSNGQLIIRVTIPNLKASYKVLLSGDLKEVGCWNLEKAIPMEPIEGLRYECNLETSKIKSKELKYKFVIYNGDKKEYIWEDGEDRVLKLPENKRHGAIIYEHSFAGFNCEHPRFTGTAVPVFSLRSKNSLGIGDFGDIKLLIDWAKQQGQSIIQLLPVNDTSVYMTWKDSYPYNCLSVMALHPIYADIHAIGKLKDSSKEAEFLQRGEELNAMRAMEYDKVWDLKMEYLRALYNDYKADIEAEPDYYKFIKKSREWVFSYSTFCVLRDKFGTSDFSQWGEFSNYSTSLIAKLASAESEYCNDIHFYIFIQYNLYKQLTEVKAYAHKMGIALKGDIPIGISPFGVDAWQYNNLFNFNQSAGAPPDYFSQDGQNWGFPTYKWEEMAKDNYRWWRKRLRYLSLFFDAYRIDHILGFFRIFEIPKGIVSAKYGHFNPVIPLSVEEINQHGLYGVNYNGLFIEDPYKPGFYNPMISAPLSQEFRNLSPNQQQSFSYIYHNYFEERNNTMWYNNAMRKLHQLIACTNMLTCGEDLGMLNASVFECMQNLKILSLELQQMPKDPGVEYADIRQYPYLSVCTTSTHDCEPLRIWLGRKNNEFRLDINGDKIYDASPESCKAVIQANLDSPSMFAILPIQDWFSADPNLRVCEPSTERINDPGNPNHYWRYRIHVNLEDLLNNI